MDKYVGFAKEHGTRAQYRLALEMMLPTSSLYDYLEGRFPHPSHTYQKVVEIIESEESEWINKLIGERRTRLGAKIGQVTTDVKREVFETSNLEHLYGCIIDWSNDDDIRRLYEERLLQRNYNTLTVLPGSKKTEKRAQVQKEAEGMVILKRPFPLAWQVVLEWKDVERIADLDFGILKDYVELFPEDGLAKVLRGFLGSETSPFPHPEWTTSQSEDESDQGSPITAEDRLILMTEGANQSSRSVMSQRLMGEYLLYLEEYSNAVESTQKALGLIQTEKQISGLEFQNNLDSVNLILGTSLVHHEAPRNHSEARAIFESILQRKPSNTSALIGIGLILEEEEEYDGAIDFLSRAQEKSSDIKIKSETAWCKSLNGKHQDGLEELKVCLKELESLDTPSKELRAQILYRIGICMWNLDSSKAGRKDRNRAYAQFLAALQANLNFAPAYTSLGKYYSDYGKDRKRARKCFQKAFELSASEVEAAERLARGFADQGEWDLVEVVAQRVVDSGKVRPPPGSKRKGLSWPFAALGVCQLNNQDYPRSIVSFQSALRASPNDYHCWVGLGEGYHNSGRYIAATKAFEQAERLESGTDWKQSDSSWFSKYMLANVRRELGDYEEAVAGYESVLASKPDEFGVCIALLQTHVESAWRCIELGLFGRAASSSAKAILVAKDIVEHRPKAFNLWKAIGDACTIFLWSETYIDVLPVEDIFSLLKSKIEAEMYERLSDIDGIGQDSLTALASSSTSVMVSVQAAVLAHKRAIHCSSHDLHAQSVAWYNLGWAEYRASVCLADTTKKTRQYLRASVQCFKRAIELEAGNSEFWNSLGVVTTQLNPKVAQHAFVRSLYLNDKSARTWTNLGTLYLIQNDTELASEAFNRGQSADPDYAHAWLGQGILALLLGDGEEAKNMFTHAFEIADSSSFIAKRLYASSVFDNILSSKGTASKATDLLQSLFALHQLKSQTKSDFAYKHLSALFAERIGDHTEPIEVLNSVCLHVESEYESSESPIALAHFAQAKADLARAQLASGDFSAAAENAEIALDLSTEEDSGLPDKVTRRRYRLSAHLTSGLAYNYAGEMDKAIPMFRSALEKSSGNPDIVCLLAQVLWAKGGEEERSVAREQLFDCIENNPTHAGAITLLAVIALLDDDKETLEAVAADLHNLRTRADIGARQQLQISNLIAVMAKLDPTGQEDGSLEIAEAATTIMLSPAQPHGWSQLAGLAGSEEVYPSDMTLLTVLAAVPPKGTLGAEELSRAYAEAGRPADRQRAIMMAPWLVGGWEVMSDE